jgi:hypothetical protein
VKRAGVTCECVLRRCVSVSDSVRERVTRVPACLCAGRVRGVRSCSFRVLRLSLRCVYTHVIHLTCLAMCLAHSLFSRTATAYRLIECRDSCLDRKYYLTLRYVRQRASPPRPSVLASSHRVYPARSGQRQISVLTAVIRPCSTNKCVFVVVGMYRVQSTVHGTRSQQDAAHELRPRARCFFLGCPVRCSYPLSVSTCLLHTRAAHHNTHRALPHHSGHTTAATVRSAT